MEIHILFQQFVCTVAIWQIIFNELNMMDYNNSVIPETKPTDQKLSAILFFVNKCNAEKENFMFETLKVVNDEFWKISGQIMTIPQTKGRHCQCKEPLTSSNLIELFRSVGMILHSCLLGDKTPTGVSHVWRDRA